MAHHHFFPAAAAASSTLPSSFPFPSSPAASTQRAPPTRRPTTSASASTVQVVGRGGQGEFHAPVSAPASLVPPQVAQEYGVASFRYVRPSGEVGKGFRRARGGAAAAYGNPYFEETRPKAGGGGGGGGGSAAAATAAGSRLRRLHRRAQRRDVLLHPVHARALHALRRRRSAPGLLLLSQDRLQLPLHLQRRLLRLLQRVVELRYLRRRRRPPQGRCVQLRAQVRGAAAVGGGGRVLQELLCLAEGLVQRAVLGLRAQQTLLQVCHRRHVAGPRLLRVDHRPLQHLVLRTQRLHLDPQELRVVCSSAAAAATLLVRRRGCHRQQAALPGSAGAAGQAAAAHLHAKSAGVLTGDTAAAAAASAAASDGRVLGAPHRAARGESGELCTRPLSTVRGGGRVSVSMKYRYCS
eukprot:Rhum_TRINITY_DN13633_c2_g2::Rhum_TRINITY_DN13633_c2_g2_i1::g.62372::m.62372